MTATYSSTDACYRQHRQNYPEPFRLRIHRALSWLERAECSETAACPSDRSGKKAPLVTQPAENDLDLRFIALWIAFNAAYAREIDGRNIAADRSDLRGFLQTVCRLDTGNMLYALVWEKFSGSIRLLLANRFTFQPFWDFHNGKISETAWREDFAAGNKKVQAALAAQDTDTVLSAVFDRLYTLRNQLIHGGSTFGSSANRAQLRDACAILSSLIPAILQVMQNHPNNDWGKPYYPFVRED